MEHLKSLNKETLQSLCGDGRCLFAASALAGLASTLCDCPCKCNRLSSACDSIAAPALLSAPVAEKMPTTLSFGVRDDASIAVGDNPMSPAEMRIDDYYWLRDDTRSNLTVLTHLQAENAYAEQQMAHLSGFRQELYEDMKSHLKETDEDVPFRRGEFFYYNRTVEGKSYKIHCRQRSAAPSNGCHPNPFGCSGKSAKDLREQILLDENVLAEGLDYCDVHTVEVSASQSMALYAVDTTGNEVYDIRLKRSFADKDHPAALQCHNDEVQVQKTDGSIVWAADDCSFFYLTQDSEHRPHRLFLHRIGTPQESDLCLFEESDQKFWLQIEQSKDSSMLLLSSASKETSEVHVLSLCALSKLTSNSQALNQSDVQKLLKCVQTRVFGLRYTVEHRNGVFLLVTNANGCINNQLMQVNADEVMNGNNGSTKDLWKSVRAYDANEQIDFVIPFATFVAIFGRASGLPALWVVTACPETQVLTLDCWKSVTFPEKDCYALHCGDNYDFHSPVVRVVYSSFLTPKQTLDYEVPTGALLIRKSQVVPGYDKSLFESRRMFATSRDGKTQIPMSMVFHKKVLEHRDGTFRYLCDNYLYRVPVVLYGYGSYGACIDASFDFKRLALLERGVVFVIAHIRGGGENGHQWYETQGKYLHKLNTFYDFIDCAKALLARQITTPSQLAIVGRSAGGLLIGSVVNMAPTLFQCAVADVPFVDVVNTMSDASIPLTVTEWEEWGNPNEKQFFDYMLSYSPYDNVRAGPYPALLISGGLHDPRVAYWEPAKWAAKLRALKTDSNPLLLKTDMSAGHFSASDRYKYIKEMAFEYAFILEQIKATKKI